MVLIFYIKKTKPHGKFCKYIVNLAVLLASSHKFQSDREDFVHNSSWYLYSLQEVLLFASQPQTPGSISTSPQKKEFRRKIIQNWVVWNYFWPELESPLALNMPFILALELCSRRWGRAQAQCHVSEQNTHFTLHSHCLYLIACEYLTGNGTGYSAFIAFRKQIIGKLVFVIVKGTIVLLDWPKPNYTRDAKEYWQSILYWAKMR